MKAWITTFTGQYFETQDNFTYSKAIATETKRQPSPEAEREIKIQAEVTSASRKQAIAALGLTPDPIITTDKEPTKP